MELENEIKEQYCLEIDKIEKNEDSTEGNVYMIFSSLNMYVAKIYNSLEHVKTMIILHNHLIENDMNVPKILLNKNNQGYSKLKDNKYFIIYYFLPGKEIGQVFKNLSNDISIKIAKELKKFHQITSPENKYNLKPVPFIIDKKFDRTSALHFDLTKSNIFYNSEWEKQIGFIDFDDAKYGPSIVDVAVVILLLFFSKTRGVDIEGAKTFINEYYDDIKTKEIEVPYLKRCALQWVLYIMDNNQFDSSTTESFEIKKALIESQMNFN